jgi:hypothetical protein
MTQIQLDKFEIEAVIELIIDINEFNDEPTLIRFWNGIIRKLDPDQKYAEDAELKGGKNHPATPENTKGQINMGIVRYGGEDGA